MSNARTKRVKLPAPSVPRSEEAIKADYNRAMSELATAEYLSFVYAKNKEQINNALVSLNHELKARNDLTAMEAKNESNPTQQPQA